MHTIFEVTLLAVNLPHSDYNYLITIFQRTLLYGISTSYKKRKIGQFYKAFVHKTKDSKKLRMTENRLCKV